MRYRALACDYDGTLARSGIVSPSTINALQRFVAAGGRLILITGRRLAHLRMSFTRLDLFAGVVLENGALLFYPSRNEKRMLCSPPPAQFFQVLRERGIPAGAGDAIAFSGAVYADEINAVIDEYGFDLHVVLNKRDLMVLPAGVDKESGLRTILQELTLSQQDVVGVGDAENDIAFLNVCGYSVAVQNALPSVKQQVDLVTIGNDGDGVSELIAQLLVGANTSA